MGRSSLMDPKTGCFKHWRKNDAAMKAQIQRLIIRPVKSLWQAMKVEFLLAEDAQSLPAVYQSEVEDRNRPLERLTLYTIILFLTAGLVWAYFAELDEVTVGQGKVIPSSQIQIIQNLEGGILAEMKVKEGDIVVKDQVLLRLNDTRHSSSYREGRSRYLALLAANLRLNAETSGTRLSFPPEIQREAPDLVRYETNLYQSRLNALEVGIASLKQSYKLANDELRILEPLVAKGATSRVEIIRLTRQLNEIQGAIDDKRNKYRADALTELNKIKADLDSLKESNVANSDRVERTVVRSPMNGVVKKVNVTTVGGVIQPGMDILEVVPIENNLLVEAQVKPADIAFLRPGQNAMVKITAYDFSIYGGLEATVEQISADTITDEKKNESYYKIQVRTKSNFLGTSDRPLPIIPGMVASVEILTGKKTVLDYLLKPFLKAKEQSLRER
jgi:adhesin transport system membrane fusion protein